MDLKETLAVINAYNELVGKGLASPVLDTLDDCSGVMLHYVDHRKNEVYYKCTVCDRKVRPGLLFFNKLRTANERWSDEADNLG